MSPFWRTLLLTCLTLLAFAGNSLFGRMALREEGIDPASYTLIRLLAGALVLNALVRGRHRRAGNWGSALALFVYAAGFSFAYVGLDTGIGALILFGAVQITMIASGLRAGERLHARALIGMAIAIAGLVILLRPGTQAPALLASALMLSAGVAWGVYSLRGRGLGNPLAATAGNFLRATACAALLALAFLKQLHPHGIGVLWAVLSGAVTSGLGYALWYHILPTLTSVRAATVQLTVPVIATALGVIVLAEPVSARLLVAGTMVVGGVGLTLLRR